MEPHTGALPEQSPPAVNAAKGERVLGVMPTRMVDGFAAVSSLALGGLVAWREILSESYANFTALDLVDDIKQTYRKDFGHAMIREIETNPDKKAVAKKIIGQSKAYDKAIAQRFNDSEFAGFKGFFNRTQLLNSHERWKIGLTAGAVTAVALGSILIFTRDLFKDKGKGNGDAPAEKPTSFAEAEQEKAAKDIASQSLAR